jgi:hypothetical protein
MKIILGLRIGRMGFPCATNGPKEIWHFCGLRKSLTACAGRKCLKSASENLNRDRPASSFYQVASIQPAYLCQGISMKQEATLGDLGKKAA